MLKVIHIFTSSGRVYVNQVHDHTLVYIYTYIYINTHYMTFSTVNTIIINKLTSTAIILPYISTYTRCDESTLTDTAPFE